MASLQTNVLIVGGDLAGLSLAWQCQQRGIDYQWIKARARLGGRVMSQAVTRVSRTANRSQAATWKVRCAPPRLRCIKFE